MPLLILSISVLALLLLLEPTQSTYESPMVIINGGKAGTCPSQEERDAIIQNIRETSNNLIAQIAPVVKNCGLGQWHCVASLNMSDPAQQCPSAWREYNTNGVRACGRPSTSNGSCPATVYAVHHQYSRVCGRAIGYQIGSPDAFGHETIPQPDSYYVHGVSITHGTPHNHIWTYAAGLSEGDFRPQRDNCPCSNSSHPDNAYPPSFIGDNYYCESGNPTSIFVLHHLYSADPLWDGQQCEGECCSNGKSPPWFRVELPNPTTDDIEVRICSSAPTVDDIPIQLLELYID